MTGQTADPTLGEVVEALGAETVVLLNDAMRDVRVGGPRLWDGGDVHGLASGDIVLAVNVAAAPELLGRLAQAGVAAVAFKGGLDALRADADRVGVGLLAVAEEVTWDQLYGLLQRASSMVGTTQEGDLFAFSNALAALVGGAVAIEDPRGSLLAYSNLDQEIDEPRRQTILGRGNPANWAQRLEDDGYYKLMAAAPGPIRLSDPEGKVNDRLVTLVRAGSEVLGTIWVVQPEAPLGEDAEAALASAVPQAAMHLLRLRSHHDSGRRERGGQLRALLEGGPAGDLGIATDSVVQLVAFHVSGEDAPDLSVNRTRVMDAIAMACEAFRRRVVCAWIGEVVYALFPDVSPSTAGPLRALVDDVCERTSRALGVDVVAALSDAHDGLASVPLCRQEADKVLRVLAERAGGQRIGTVEETRITGTLLALADLMRERPDLRIPAIAELARHDAERGKDYLPTLRALIRASGSIPDAAAALGVHVNTVRYRLTRLQELSGLDLNDPDTRLVVSVELLVLDS